MPKLIDWEALQAALSPADFEEIKKQIVDKLTPKAHSFTPMLMLDRGLGREYRNLDTVCATTIEDAEVQAKHAAEVYLTTPGYEKAEILEVRLRPING